VAGEEGAGKELTAPVRARRQKGRYGGELAHEQEELAFLLLGR
jgi:hypothetical protein